MSDTTASIISAVIGGFIGIAGTLIGAVYMTSKQRFIEASLRLRHAFHDEIATLCDPFDNGDPYEFLHAAFRKHLIAITEFRYFLPHCRVASFDKTWHEYYCDDGNPSMPFLEQYSKHLGEH